MDVRDFTGCFVVDGRETDEMNLRVIVSVGGGGVISGSGAFVLPLALVGRGRETLTFRLVSGEELRLVVREIDLAEGVAYFLTEGAVPAGAPTVAEVARRA